MQAIQSKIETERMQLQTQTDMAVEDRERVAKQLQEHEVQIFRLRVGYRVRADTDRQTYGLIEYLS